MTASRAEDTSTGPLAWVASVDHKQIGILYLITTLVFLAVGGIEALLMRVQLARPGNTFLSPEAYNQLFTMHGTTMVFLVVIPLLIGFGTYLVPLMIGARDMAFPRLNALSYWLLLFGGLLLYFSFVAGGAPDAGWFSYAPLSEPAYATGTGVDYWALGLLVIGIGTVASGINFIVTIVTLRAPGMSIRRLPLFVWMTLVNAFLIIVALPALNASLVMLLIDRRLGSGFFDASAGGSPILWQHYFWSFGHPEVYIMVLPAFGIISEVIPVFSRQPIYGYGFVAASTVAIALLSFGVWAHHMFAVGLGHTWDVAFGATSMLIAIPTGVKIFNWIATMWGGAIQIHQRHALCHGLSHHVHDRRDHRCGFRHRPHRLAADRHVFRGGTHALRALRWNALRRVRRGVLLVPEDQRTDAFGAAGSGALLAHRDWLQYHVLHPACARRGRHAAPGVHVSGLAPLGGDEPGVYNWRLHPCAFVRGIRLERGRELALRGPSWRQSVASVDAGMGDDLASSAHQLRSGAARQEPASPMGFGAPGQSRLGVGRRNA